MNVFSVVIVIMVDFIAMMLRFVLGIRTTVIMRVMMFRAESMVFYGLRCGWVGLPDLGMTRMAVTRMRVMTGGPI